MTINSPRTLGATLNLIRSEKDKCIGIVQQWTNSDHIQLHAGEMTAQELRSVKAVVDAILREMRGY